MKNSEKKVKRWKKWGSFCLAVLSLCMCLGIVNGKQAKAAGDFVISKGVSGRIYRKFFQCYSAGQRQKDWCQCI